MGYNRQENVQRLNRFVHAYADNLEWLADELLDDVGPEEAQRLMEEAKVVRAQSIPVLPFLRR